MQSKKHNRLGPNVSITPCTVLDSLDLNDESRESESTDTEEEMSVSKQQKRETNAGKNNEEKSKKEKIVSLTLSTRETHICVFRHSPASCSISLACLMIEKSFFHHFEA